jgi:hypothetical protein
MKKAGSIFLLFIFLFNTMGYFIAFKVSQVQIKQEIRRDIERGTKNCSVSEITIENSKLASINWVEDDEFEFNNERYDLLKKSPGSKSTTFICINDSKESSLFGNMNEHVKNNVSGTKSTKDSSSKSITDNVVKISKQVSFSFNPSVIFINSNSFLPFLSNYKFALIKANFQPPELA